jgi:hypothetical protein
VARRGWATVAVGSQLGSHLGYPATPTSPPECSRSTEAATWLREIQATVAQALGVRVPGSRGVAALLPLPVRVDRASGGYRALSGVKDVDGRAAAQVDGLTPTVRARDTVPTYEPDRMRKVARLLRNW